MMEFTCRVPVLKDLISGLLQQPLSQNQRERINSLLASKPYSSNFIVETRPGILSWTRTAVEYLNRYRPANFTLREYIHLTNAHDIHLNLRITVEQASELSALVSEVFNKQIRFSN